MAAKSCDLHQPNYAKKLPMIWGIFSESFMILAQMLIEIFACLCGGTIIIMIRIPTKTIGLLRSLEALIIIIIIIIVVVVVVVVYFVSNKSIKDYKQLGCRSLRTYKAALELFAYDLKGSKNILKTIVINYIQYIQGVRTILSNKKRKNLF